MAITAHQLLGRFPRLLSGLDVTEAQIFLDTLVRRDVDSGQVVVRADELGDALHLVWEGRVAFYKEYRGREVCFGSLGRSRFFGSEQIVTPAAEPTTVRTMEPTVLLRLDHEALETLGEKYPRLSSNLLRALSRDMVGWLRTFETYMSQRALPNDLDECVAIVKKLRRLGEV